jgi:hypothetical protein
VKSEIGRRHVRIPGTLVRERMKDGEEDELDGNGRQWLEWKKLAWKRVTWTKVTWKKVR